MDTHMEKYFQNLGFSKKETEIFLCLSKHGSLSISLLSEKTGIGRTGLYYLLPGLIKRGVVRKQISGKRLSYSIAGQDAFIQNLEESIAALRDFAEERKRQKEHFELSIFTKKKDLAQVMRKMLALEKGEVIYSLEGDETIRWMGGVEESNSNWQKECERKGIVLKAVGSESAVNSVLKNWSPKILKNMTRRSISPKIIANQILKNYQIMLVAYRDEVIIFIPSASTVAWIRNGELSDSVKAIIDFMYDSGTYVKLNELIKNRV